MNKKRNRIITILGLIFVVLALGFLILGFAISGADILGWFGSKWAMWFYVFLGVYVLVCVFWYVWDRIKKL